jgi:MYXO-CTERM domain-containing protein
MRRRISLALIIAFSLWGPRLALADDGGDAAIDEAGIPTYEACDGNLCDSLQGRPDGVGCACSTTGYGSEPASGFGAILLGGALLLRRSRTGARRPFRGGEAC